MFEKVSKVLIIFLFVTSTGYNATTEDAKALVQGRVDLCIAEEERLHDELNNLDDNDLQKSLVSIQLRFFKEEQNRLSHLIDIFDEQSFLAYLKDRNRRLDILLGDLEKIETQSPCDFCENQIWTIDTGFSLHINSIKKAMYQQEKGWIILMLNSIISQSDVD